MSINLDPREVLQYLNHLGYNNVTKDQLKEFIYDLKKLVKYDDSSPTTTKFDCPQPQNIYVTNPTPARCRPRARPTQILDAHAGFYQDSETLEDLIAPCNTTDSSYRNLSTDATSECPVAIGKENVRGRKQQREKSYSSSTTTNSSGSESVSLSSNSSSPSSLDIFNTKAKLTEGSHGSGKHSKVTTKTTTSFIRPWRLVSAPAKSVPDQRRTDPVSLYHHYQTIWKRQKLPGEDSRAELRWSIREKMLGQDPHPRPMSQASSVEHLKRHQTKK